MPRYAKHQPPPGYFVTEIDGRFVAGEILTDTTGAILDLLPFKHVDDASGDLTVILFTRNDAAVRACEAAHGIHERTRRTTPHVSDVVS